MTRMQKLKECLEIAIRHKNPLMEENIRKEIERDRQNPSLSTETYPEA